MTEGQAVPEDLTSRPSPNERPRTTTTALDLKREVHGLNAFLSAVYGKEMRISAMLAQSGLGPEQVECLRTKHLHQVVICLLDIIQQRFTRYTRGDQMYQILCRSFGIASHSQETLQAIGESYGVTRERIRQLEQKALRRCRARAQLTLWEISLRASALSLLGDETFEFYVAESSPDPILKDQDEEPFTNCEDSLTEASITLEDEQVQLRRVQEMIIEIRNAVGDNLSVFMLTHILVGDRGPVVDAVVGFYRLDHLHGTLQALGYEKTKQLVMQVPKPPKKVKSVLSIAPHESALDADELAQVADLVATIQEKIGSGLWPTMYAHILFGSKGPKVDELEATHGFAEYGTLRSWGFPRVKDAVWQAVTEAARP